MTLNTLKQWKTYPSYKSSGVDWLGDIPDEWEVKPLRAILDQRYEYNLGRKTENILSVIKDVGVINYDDREASGNKKSERIEQYKVIYPNDIVVNRMNLIFGSVGIAKEYGASSTEYYVLKPKSEETNNLYYSYIFCNKSFQQSLVGIGKGILFHRMRIYSEEFKKIIFPFPPLHEQEKIAQFLDEETTKIDKLITLKQRLIELLKEKRTALISHAVTKGLNPDVPMKDSGVEWLGLIPEHWDVKQFRYCASIANGQINPSQDNYKNMILIAPNHIESGTGTIIYTETAEEQGAISGKYLCKIGDVLYSKIRPELIKACLSYQECLCSADMYPLTPKKDIFGSFLLYTLLSDWFTRFAILESDRVAMPKVNRESLNNCYVIVPPFQEQQKIAEYLDEKTEQIDQIINKTRESIEYLKEYRTALISAAVTGKIDVRELGD